ncbi:MAG TPA: lysophospholipid acyltransferase family protein [Dehalococcoidia bacterium]|nr:lysophospholipid acyltransferase family protein [Dehalococcoidia bacterium]
MSLLYWTQVRVLLPCLCRALMRLEVIGQENVPCGPVILAANHPDNWDPYISNLAIRQRAIHHFARADGMASFGLGTYWRQLGAIPANSEGLREALRILRLGGVVGVYPEGRIAPALTLAGNGAATLALRSGAPIVPVAVWGTERIHPYSPHRRPQVTIRYGTARLAERCNGAPQRLSDSIMADIAAMLPASYRGVYASAAKDGNAAFQRSTAR